MKRARDHRLGRATQREPEGFLIRADHAALVVEAVEVVGDLDRVDRDRVRAAALGRLRDHAGEFREPLDQLSLLGRELGRRLRRDCGVAGIAQDTGNAGVRVLDIEDGILGGALGGEIGRASCRERV